VPESIASAALAAKQTKTYVLRLVERGQAFSGDSSQTSFRKIEASLSARSQSHPVSTGW